MGMADHDWVKVSERAAKEHRLYGIWGWLAIFFILSSIGVTYSIIELINFINKIKNVSHKDSTFFYIILLSIGLCIFYYTISILSGQKGNNKFPKLIISAFYIIIMIQIFILVYTYTFLRANNYPKFLLGDMIFYSMIGVMSSFLWIRYFTVSRRVRVTYRHEVRRDDPMAREVKPIQVPDVGGQGYIERAVGEKPDTATPPSEAPRQSWPPSSSALIPPPSPAHTSVSGVSHSVRTRLRELKALYEEGLIDEEVYKQREAAILQDL